MGTLFVKEKPSDRLTTRVNPADCHVAPRCLSNSPVMVMGDIIGSPDVVRIFSNQRWRRSSARMKLFPYIFWLKVFRHKSGDGIRIYRRRYQRIGTTQFI